jgi:hypothetical protein
MNWWAECHAASKLRLSINAVPLGEPSSVTVESAKAMLQRVTVLPIIFGTLSLALVAGCQSTESIPREVHGDAAWNYQRVFREPTPGDVTVVNSVVVTYADRWFAVTTDDYEFELLVPQHRIERFVERFYLRRWDASPGSFFDKQIQWRKQNGNAWYAPKALDQYETYRDSTSVGYNHMLVDKIAESDGRRRVFISKH